MADTTDQIVELFEAGGIETVFGFPCEQMDPYYSSLADSSVRHVLARSEASAALMADGYARANRTIGVVDGVGGPGAAYIGAGLCEADGASSPVLALTGDNERDIRGREVIQDADNEAILEPYADTTFDAESADRAVEAVDAAIRLMTTGVPKPAHVNLPGDVLVEDSSYSLPDDVPASYPADRPEPNAERVTAVVEKLDEAETPVILAGEGVVRAGASELLTEFATRTNTPVVTSINGKGAVAETEPFALGVAGRWGFCQVANDALSEADLVVGLGTRFSDLTTVGWSLLDENADVVHVDLDEAWLGKNYEADVAIHADLRATLAALLESADADYDDRESRIESLDADRAEWRQSHADDLTSDAAPVAPARVVEELNERIPANGVLVSATSYSGFFSGAFYEVEEPGLGYLQARGSDGINASLPQALGVQAARPETPVVALSGDGGIGYHISDLETAVREDLPLTVVILNNDGLGSSKASQVGTDNFQLSTDFEDGVDYAAVARGFGCRGARIETTEELLEELPAAIDSDEPTLLDVQVDPYAVPPVLV
ncbi:thiamine pyrophosphate-binding protein [Natronomonas halophila]|uniref:thiamine pyrophosphate-binding protein n=1 Tax=Natronomonas halophila TaxID=2747817 RepID=UPI0015B43E53|nr:thiamine pyrophosphate-binding protein [Natronomonas halophila]QLD84318.1 thiamine pyrophosphate-binding protein [Natronomonas halophila]